MIAELRGPVPKNSAAQKRYYGRGGLSCEVTIELKARVKELASKAGITPASFVRNALLAHVREQSKVANDQGLPGCRSEAEK